MNQVAAFSPTLARFLEVPGVLPVVIFVAALVVISVTITSVESATGKNLGEILSGR